MVAFCWGDIMNFKQIMEYSEDNGDVFDDLCKDKRKESDNCIPFVGRVYLALFILAGVSF